MASTHIIQQYGESSLYAVPGVHFNDLFACEVNRICADPTTQPAAIAVELGPSMTAGALEWLQELVGEPGKRLPIMLALVGTNRFIRGSLRDKARRLQVEMGKDLSEMSPDVLRRELGFSSHELLCLSPADSIVEALRCGIELDVPVYGVDLDGFAGHLGGAAVIRDPFASPDAGAFALGNAGLADQLRDEEVDSRRELAMAARLKTLLQKYSKVLFTGGLGHWLRLSNLLGDGSLRPAPVGNVPDKGGGCFIRAVIHPALALRCIDPFPMIPVLYEETRVPAHLPFAEKEEVRRRANLDHVSIFRDCLDRAYRSYFQKETVPGGDEERHLDLQTLPAFEVYLRNLCLLGHRRTPHLFSVLASSREMMSPSFSQTMAATFMDVPWAKPADLPDGAIILPAAAGEDSMVLIQNGGKKENIYSRFLHGNNGGGNIEVACDWSEHQQPPEFQFVRTYLHSWPPWDHLMTSLSLRAIMLGKQRQKKMRTQVFEDSLLEGVDMKATVRAFSRGEERYYVRDLSRKNESLANPLEGFPVVWITHCEASTADN